MQRPNDIVTGMVVAKQRGMVKLVYGRYSGDKEDYFKSPFDGPRFSYSDPRTDPNAALKLLHHLFYASLVHEIQPDKDGWHIWMENLHDYLIPISGPEFCIAVVNLAINVMGIEAKGGG